MFALVASSAPAFVALVLFQLFSFAPIESQPPSLGLFVSTYLDQKCSSPPLSSLCVPAGLCKGEWNPVVKWWFASFSLDSSRSPPVWISQSWADSQCSSSPYLSPLIGEELFCFPSVRNSSTYTSISPCSLVSTNSNLPPRRLTQLTYSETPDTCASTPTQAVTLWANVCISWNPTSSFAINEVPGISNEFTQAVYNGTTCEPHRMVRQQSIYENGCYEGMQVIRGTYQVPNDPFSKKAIAVDPLSILPSVKGAVSVVAYSDGKCNSNVAMFSASVPSNLCTPYSTGGIKLYCKSNGWTIIQYYDPLCTHPLGSGTSLHGECGFVYRIPSVTWPILPRGAASFFVTCPLASENEESGSTEDDPLTLKLSTAIAVPLLLILIMFVACMTWKWWKSRHIAYVSLEKGISTKSDHTVVDDAANDGVSIPPDGAAVADSSQPEENIVEHRDRLTATTTEKKEG